MLTQNGIDYICQNFGNDDFCCIDTGLSWSYEIGGASVNENGGTAQVVSRLVSGLVDSITMIIPNRGVFTKAQLDIANGQAVTMDDCQIIARHDEPSEDQWCSGSQPPQPPGEINWYLVGGVVVVAVLGIGYIIIKKRKL